MTNDSHLFRTAAQLEAEGFYPVAGNTGSGGRTFTCRFTKGKMVQALRPPRRSACGQSKIRTTGLPSPEEATPRNTGTRSLVTGASVLGIRLVGWELQDRIGLPIGFKEHHPPTNVQDRYRSASSHGPGSGTRSLILKPQTEIRCLLRYGCTGLANLNPLFRFPYQAESYKANILIGYPGTTPRHRASDYDQQFGNTTARELVRDHVLRLTYTAHDMAPFARDLGYDGPPFLWDEEERRHLRARLDALYFHLYGLNRDDAGYVLDTFPIVRREDEAKFGHYRTRELILAYMNALAAGDTETVVAV